MSRRTDHARRSAVRSFWRTVAAGGRPDDQDLQRAGFPQSTWRGIHDLAGTILTTRGDGNHGAARRLADEAAHALLLDLGDQWSPPAPPGPDLDLMTPAELADYITSGRVPQGRHRDPLTEVPR